MFMWEKNIESFEDLYERTDAAAARFNELNSRNKAAESQMVANLASQKHIQNYAKARDVYDAYRKSNYSKKFFEERRAEVTLHKAAKEAFNAAEGSQASDDQRTPTGICAADCSEEGSLQRLSGSKTGNAGAAKSQTERGQSYGDDLKKER